MLRSILHLLVTNKVAVSDSACTDNLAGMLGTDDLRLLRTAIQTGVVSEGGYLTAYGKQHLAHAEIPQR